MRLAATLGKAGPAVTWRRGRIERGFRPPAAASARTTCARWPGRLSWLRHRMQRSFVSAGEARWPADRLWPARSPTSDRWRARPICRGTLLLFERMFDQKGTSASQDKPCPIDRGRSSHTQTAPLSRLRR